MSLVRCSSAETCGGFNDAIVSVQRGTFRIFFLSFSATLIGGSGLKGGENPADELTGISAFK
jgi:hypothetical protein